ncbi:alpha-N-acetylgalactosaminide alpha-2,6-sialyltransferase 2-like isoform X1 [Tympanuchus pallidicinctus]|uniref:alpha-N-acetylgalactosaminide alpha-2,6-sialyltransferase 2-like isoform X1 n=1 Tax=Tympanuchus pallidicinctus TaxID=109042 RepID=UPI002286FDA7|nr:alpha-N-acetylgalactosaminide alpha-2,6-sialyltransferase 2-like isoform X1 [Tympanuchus pallidicinctus]
MINPEPTCACPLSGFCARCSSWPRPGAQRGDSKPSSCFLFCGVGVAQHCSDGCGQSHSGTPAPVLSLLCTFCRRAGDGDRTPLHLSWPPLSSCRTPVHHRATTTAAPQQVTQAAQPSPVPGMPPDLGDTYGQDETYSSSGCPNSIRKRIGATEFGDTFLPTIPVLQWARHAQQDEYQRLRRYRGAHGWKDIRWDVLKSSLSLLNASSSALLFDTRPLAASCIRCAVVGNGGILHGSGMGPAIDAHDYVFRVNGAITEGFEHDVGSRTSFYVFSTNTMVNALHSYAADGFRHPPQTPETCYVFLPDHDRDYLLLRAALSQQRVDSGRDEGVRPQEFFGEDLQVGKFRMLHPDFIRYLRNRFLRSHILATPLWQLYRPSTGAVMLLTAIHTCDQVSAFGFMTPGYRAYSDHYFDRGHKEVQFFINHDLRMEMQLWQRLQSSGILWLYTGSEGT